MSWSYLDLQRSIPILLYIMYGTQILYVERHPDTQVHQMWWVWKNEICSLPNCKESVELTHFNGLNTLTGLFTREYNKTLPLILQLNWYSHSLECWYAVSTSANFADNKFSESIQQWFSPKRHGTLGYCEILLRVLWGAM